MKNYTRVADITNLNELVQSAIELKKEPYALQALGKNKTLVMLFFNPSLRTRLSTEKAALHLGMHVITMNISSDGWILEFEDGSIMENTAAEHVKEAAQVVSQYADVIAVRAFAQLKNQQDDYEEKVIKAFIKYASVPILSLESATGHPLQALADAITIKEHLSSPKPKVVLTWAPHPKALPQAVANSFVEMMQKMDVELVITHPKGYELSPDIVKESRVEYDQDKAFEQADFVYAKNWSAFESYGKVLSVDRNWTVTAAKMEKTNSAKFMHCLPVRRNVVVEDAVLDSDYSVVIDQANNRTYAAQVVLSKILGA
ncbi:N-acetylornithine carbamoyltransferase [Flavobacteriaceae bacterium F08102]|nr:N-acetylornithine carbamoyltransferase [Flavobacteriaceae bacterium F08102]